MITKRRLNIPIFNYKLVIVIYDKWEEVKDMHKGSIEPNAFTRIFPEGYMYEIMKMAREKKNSGNEHFNESYAKYLVSNMYHYEGGRKYVGEKFSMAKAKEVCERYRGVIPQSFTHADVYVAINEHYHNCSELFKSWFGEDIDQKVIEAAILFWFKDDDCKSNSKLWNHFKEN